MIAGSALPGLARAGNGGHPRTPVEWPEGIPCMTVVDRSQSSALQFDYAIPYPDDELTPDELPTSRRHQFIAFCRDASPQDGPPVWLSWADADAWLTWAGEKMIDAEAIDDEDVLETNSVYKDCFVRITADDARRPITEAAAMQPVVWDTAGLAAGAYKIDGYTWEPELNRWSRRPGVVHVVDGPDLADAGPAAALTNEEGAFVFTGDSYPLTGCARAMPGSTVSGHWALADALGWHEFASQPLAGETIALPFTPPPGVVGTVALRVDITDPQQRTWSAYPVSLLEVVEPVETTGGETCSDGASFLDGPTMGTCGDAGSSTGTSGDTGETTIGTSTTDASTTTGAATSAPAREPDPGGCGCRGGVAPPGFAWLWLLARRRRRRAFPLRDPLRGSAGPAGGDRRQSAPPIRRPLP